MSGFSLSSEPFTLQRDCSAVMVPQGESVVLPAGQIGYITQALGGSFTVYVEGNLFRIAGKEADALGKELPPPIELPMGPERVRWEHVQTIFRQSGGNVSETARNLRMHRRTLQRILARGEPHG